MSWDDEAATWDDNQAVRTYAAAAFRSLQELLAKRGLSLQGAHVAGLEQVGAEGVGQAAHGGPG